MKLLKPHDQIYLFLADGPAELGHAFVRLAEYYESPSKLFRNKFFTLSEFKKWYCANQSITGKFSYYRDYTGFNIPGDVIQNWAVQYAGNESEDEQSLIQMLGALPKQFYVIGALEGDAGTLDHELSHALFHLFPEYRKLMVSMFEDYDLDQIRRYLRRLCYAEHVLDDEIVSYVMFEDGILHRASISTKHLRALRGGMLGAYRTYKDRFISL